MADLVTHACTALLPGALLPSRYLPLVTLGTVLPDLLGRVVPMALEPLAARVPLPDALLWPWSGLHEPAGWLLASALLSYAFVEAERGRVLAALAGGCALHLALDLLQDHHGEGYLLLAPFSSARVELGLVGSEATVGLALPLLGLTALAWALRLTRERLTARRRIPRSRALPGRAPRRPTAVGRRGDGPRGS